MVGGSLRSWWWGVTSRGRVLDLLSAEIAERDARLEAVARWLDEAPPSPPVEQARRICRGQWAA